MEAKIYSTQRAGVAGVGFAVVMDGDYVPDLPNRLFLDGRYHKTLTSVIAANNEHEVRLLVKKFTWNLLLICKDRAATSCRRRQMSQ
jgi:hypothetical protein